VIANLGVKKVYLQLNPYTTFFDNSLLRISLLTRSGASSLAKEICCGGEALTIGFRIKQYFLQVS